jgi:superoxide reductase
MISYNEGDHEQYPHREEHMATLGEQIQSADWKTEKHAPVIDCDAKVAAGASLTVTVQVGKEIAHPNTTEHHIRWINLYYKAKDDKFTYHVGTYEFNAHGESAAGANEGPVSTDPCVVTSFKPKKAGMLFATSYCNIHGLWESSKAIEVG